jgi:hypothetical protein
VIETLNINVQSSQLHLRLPDSHRWMNFGGTMTQVDDRGKLEASYLSYKSRQIQQLAEQVQSSSLPFGSFSKSRAYSSLKQLQQEMVEFASANPGMQTKSGEQLKQLVQGNNDAIQRAQELYSVQNAQSGERVIDNRVNFNGLIEQQSARIGRNLINKSEQNFSVDSAQLGLGSIQSQEGKSAAENFKSGKKGFDSKWFERNQLDGMQSRSNRGERLLGGEDISVPEEIQSQFVTAQEQPVSDSISFFNPSDVSRLGDGEGVRRWQSETGKQDTSQANKTSGGIEIVARGGVESGGGFGGGGGGMDAGGGGGKGHDANKQQDLGKFESQNENSGYGREDLLAMSSSGFGIAGPTGPLTGSALSLEISQSQIVVDEDLLGSALSSLEIELPERGLDFYFKSPRGKATVVVRPIEARSFSGWISVLITLGVCLGLWLIGWVVFRICKSSTMRVLATGGLLLAGLLSLVTAMLPVYGLLAVVASIVLFIDWSAQSVRRDELDAVSR